MTDRIGARQWQVLGAIAQVPDETMSTKDLYVHIRYYAGQMGMRHILDGLQDSGLITESKAAGTVRLTEKGATSRRSPGRANIPWFCPVARQSSSTTNR